MNESNRWKLVTLAIGLPIATAACATVPLGTEQLNAVAWVQTATEYEATARQAYRLAELRLVEAMEDPSWTAALEQGEPFADLPPAVILDVDETVLDNSPFQARLVQGRREYDSRAWSAWTAEASAPAVTGALEFVQVAESLGVRVFYVTNRDAPEEEDTRRNLERLGFGIGGPLDVVLTRGERPEWGSDKTSRRAHVASSHRVLLLIGDDLNDFVGGVRGSAAARHAVARRHEAAWGRRWIVLPNPMYGSWERSLYDFARQLPADERRRRKADSLDTQPRAEPEEPR